MIKNLTEEDERLSMHHVKSLRAQGREVKGDKLRDLISGLVVKLVKVPR